MTVTEDLEAAARFGSGGDGDGVTRLAWSEPLLSISSWFLARCRELGLDAGFDAAGNCVARWNEGRGPALAVGSHLDTVPCGGRFDGALGVLAGLAALGELKARGFRPARPIWLISFMDEEGSRFGTTMFGSRAFVGDDLGDLAAIEDEKGTSIAEAMAAAGFDAGRVAEARAVDEVGAYLELHIEQGRVLEGLGAEIGVVTSICGAVDLHATLVGHADHAGTTPMALRRDALVGAARVVTAVRDLARESEPVRATVGTIEPFPGATNVVPGRCELTVDLRAPDARSLTDAEGAIERLVARIAAEEALDATVAASHRLEPLELPQRLRAFLAEAARLEGARAVEVVSGAAHDAMVVGRHVPAGMLFVPSRDGISHNPRELTDAADCERGARVLARAIELMARGEPR